MSDEHPVLEIIEVRDAERIRIRLRGELDFAGAPTLDEALRRLRERRERVLLDLDELTFIDVSALRVILAAAEKACGDGETFAVTDGSPQVRRLIALLRIDGELPIDRSMR